MLNLSFPRSLRFASVRQLKTGLMLCLLAISFTARARAADIPAEQLQFFEQHVRPLLIERCFACHSSASETIGGNLRLDSREGWLVGGDLGTAIVPMHPEQSLLISAVRQTDQELQMPPDAKLSDQEIDVLVRWVAFGAPDPRETDLPPAVSSTIDIEARRSYWAFQSPHDSVIPWPKVEQKDWPKNEIDHFILAELEKRGLSPAAAADKRTLIRRATFDLIGLPPTPDEVQAFVADTSPDAFRKLIDRLLDSPHYGERWGRHWLDVARYADSNGLDENIAYGNAWRYRDYVVRSFNHDKPFDQFVLEQLAGDLLAEEPDDESNYDRIIATGFLSLGPKVLAEVDETKMEMDIVDEQVETVGRAFMGLTLGCARCHDHKFDPIRTDDYYALAGIFKSTKTMEHFTKIARWNEVSIATAAETKQHELQTRLIDDAKQRLEEALKSTKEKFGADAKEETLPEPMRNELKRLRDEVGRLERDLLVLPTAMGVADYDQPIDLRVHVRGSYLSQSRLAPRGFPAVLVPTPRTECKIPPTHSGRLQLANWLVDGRHPLTARVMVNRLWRWHFGRGLVETTDNLGELGSRPSNQPLLDWLSQQFVEQGWSTKAMHRLIMLSATYRMSSRQDAANAAIDEANRFFWRANLRRLEAETIRDSMLAVSGLLNRKPGGSLLHVSNREFLFDHTSIDKTRYDSNVRSLYLPVIRNHLYDGFQLFDYANASVMTSNRATTIVAPQALFLMNGELVQRAAVSFADRIGKPQRGDATRIDLSYKMALGRPATSAEITDATAFLSTAAEQSDSRHDAVDQHSAWILFSQALLMSNEFIYVR